MIQEEFGISQPAVSMPLREVDAWLDHFRGFWTQHLAGQAAPDPGGDA